MIYLKFKKEISINGNESYAASFAGKLLSISKEPFTYVNAKNDTLTYKLGTVEFRDNVGNKTVTDKALIYDTSYENDMEVGKTYLGKISISDRDVTLEDGTVTKAAPWIVLSSYVKGQELAFADFDLSGLED